MAKKKVVSPFEKTILAHVNSSAIHGLDPKAGVTKSLWGGFSVLGRVLEAVKAMLAELKDSVTPEIKAEIKTAAAAVFDQLVVLPEPFDSLSDMAFRQALEFLLGA